MWAKEEVSSAVSELGDTDYAAELSKLDRQNILMEAAVSMLSIANSQAGAVLGLLR